MRSYRQTCGVACALDLLGERWTLLVIRELALGPRRYRDLLAALPGIGTNLLATRLQTMTAEGLIEPVPAGEGYRLTADGEALRPILQSLALWGLSRVDPDAPGATARASWAALTMTAAFDPARAPAGDVMAEVRTPEETFWLGVVGGSATAGVGEPPRAPDVRVRAEALDFVRAAAGDASASASVEVVEGPREAFESVLAAVPLPV